MLERGGRLIMFNPAKFGVGMEGGNGNGANDEGVGYNDPDACAMAPAFNIPEGAGGGGGREFKECKLVDGGG